VVETPGGWDEGAVLGVAIPAGILLLVAGVGVGYGLARAGL
jgi:hypothetical protein